MKNKILKKAFPFLIAAIILQLGTIAFILMRSSSIKNEAEKANRVASFKCEMRDPSHPFKGRYVRLNLTESLKNFDELDIQSREVNDIKRSTPIVFCLLKMNSDGSYRITGLRAEEPDDSNLFVRARMLYTGGSVSLEFPFREYYMQENYAREVDSLGSAFYQLDPRIEVYIDRHGNCIQKALYVNGKQTIEDYIKSLLSQRQL